MDVLGKLFGSDSKVKIMRLFLFNPETPFDLGTIAERVKFGLFTVRQELSVLRQMRLIKPRSFMGRVMKGRKRDERIVRRKMAGFVLNGSFPYLSELQRLLLDTSLLKGDELVRKLSGAGRLKLVITSGLFIQSEDSRIDILVVADHLRRGTLLVAMRSIEAEIGKELRYAAFETNEFRYRLSMYDKLVRDILDYPHKTVLDKIGLPPANTASRGHSIELPLESSWAIADR